MRHILPVLILAATPVVAQDDEGPSLIERGVETMMRELMREMAPAFRDLEGALEMLDGVVGEMDRYEAPEILPNGDIIIRRKLEDAPAIAEDGEVEL